MSPLFIRITSETGFGNFMSREMLNNHKKKYFLSFPQEIYVRRFRYRFLKETVKVKFDMTYYSYITSNNITNVFL